MILDKSYLVTVNSDNEHYNADCDFALIDFSPELLRKLARLKKAFLEQKKRFDDLGAWHLSDNGVAFISRKAAEALLGEEKFEEMDSESGGGPYPVVNRDAVDLEKFDATNSDEMVLTADGIWWRAFPKHSEISVGSDFFAWTWFTQCTFCGLRREEHVVGLGFTKPQCLFASTGYRALLPELASGLPSRRRRASKRRVSKLRAS